jgi:ABC-type multidrug transport system ATPase subunit
MQKRLKHDGITIVVSTPYMDEAALCDRIALIQGGKLLSTDTPEKIRADYPDPLYAVKADDMYRLQKKLSSFPGILNSYRFGEYMHASFRTQAAASDVMQFLKGSDLNDLVLQRTEPTIEDCFIKLLKN